MEFADSKSLGALGWDELVFGLSTFAHTEVGKARCLALRPSKDKAWVQQRSQQVSETLVLRAQDFRFPIDGMTSIDTLLLRLRAKGALEGVEIARLVAIVRSVRDLLRFAETHKEAAPALCQKASGLCDMAAVLTYLDDCIDASGRVLDSASEDLNRYRETARRLHARAREKIEGLMGDLEDAGVLQDKFFSVRNDRYVLPVIASFQAKVPGIVHNASQTGQTIFVEPEALIQIDNELCIAESLVAEEEKRILAELSEVFFDRIEDLANNAELLADFDALEAAAGLAKHLDAMPVKFEQSGDALELPKLRHPLLTLQGANVVPNDLGLSLGRRGVVISGPNAGGKTVTLTAVGLAVAMARAGLFIPTSEPARMPWFQSVSVLLGDAQNLEQGLSTFSGHLNQLKDCVGRGRENALVLIDEIATGTSPTEGAALAQAVIEHLLDAGAWLWVTTHLDPLKAHATLDQRLVNASVALGADGQPNFELCFNRLGRSSAFGLAEQIEFPAEVLRRARDILEGDGALNEAIGRLNVQERELAQGRAELEKAWQKLEGQKRTMQDREEKLRERKQKVEVEARREMVEALGEQRALLSEAVAELQKKSGMKVVRRLQERVGQAEVELKQEMDKSRERVSDRALPASEISVGDWVFVSTMGQEGEVVEALGRSATIQLGVLKTKAKFSDLVLKRRKQIKVDPHAARRKKALAGEDTTEDSRDCDVRGMRGDEAIRKIEKILDTSLAAGKSSIRIVHGHGEGILKKMIRKYLVDSPYPSHFRGGDGTEGGDGVTVVELGA